MNHSSSSAIPPTLVALPVFAAGLALVVFAIRLNSALTLCDLCPLEGTTGVGIYNAWKVAEGHPLYEDPTSGSYSTALYNYLHYFSMAGVVRASGASGAGIIPPLIMQSVGFSIAGAVITVMVFAACRPDVRDASGRLVWTSLALFFWLGPIAGWFAISPRPDIPALMFTVLGVWWTIRKSRRHSIVDAFGASIAFYAAWACKQSVVWIFAGLVAHEVAKRRWKRAIVMSGAYVVMTGATLALGGATYRDSILAVPALSSFSFRLGIENLARVGVWGMPLWVAFPFAVREMKNDSMLRAWTFPALLSFTFGTLALFKEGSSRNQFLEFCLVATFVTGSIAVRTHRRSFQGAFALSSAVVALLLGLQLALPDRIGRLALPYAEYYSQRQAQREFLKTLPKPIFIFDEVFSLPWYSSDGRYPALVLDPVVYRALKHSGRLTPEGVGLVVERRHVGTVIASAESDAGRVARRVGYEVVVPPSGLTLTANWDDQPLHVYVRPSEKSP